MIFLADVIDWAMKAGTLPMQGLMILAIIILGWVIVYLHKQNNLKIDALHRENKTTQQVWETRIEAERVAMSVERKDRINMLIDVLREDTRTKAELKAAIDGNTRTIERFEMLLTKIIGTKIAI